MLSANNVFYSALRSKMLAIVFFQFSIYISISKGKITETGCISFQKVPCFKDTLKRRQ